MAKKTFIGYGYPLGEPGKVGKIRLKDSDRKGHLFCFGTTRIGKTRLIELMMEQDIRKGYSVVFFDPKCDITLFSKIVQVAYEENRQDELCLVTPIFPHLSAHIDPLAYYYMPEELVSHVVSGIRTREEFFANIAYETTFVIVQAFLFFAKLKHEKVTLNFNMIKERVSYRDLQALEEQLRDYEGDLEAQEILATLRQILSSSPEHFAKVSPALRAVLTSLSAGSVGAIIGKVKANNFVKRLEQGKRVILIVQTGALLTRKTSDIVSRVLLSMIQSFVGRVYLSGKKISPPLCIYMDEASNLLYIGVEDLFNKSGGAGVWVHAFTQSIADIEAEIGPPAARKILDNTNTKLFMRVNDTKTAQYIADYSGMARKFSPLLSLGGGITVREVEEPNIRPDQILKMQPREFYMFSFGGAYRGKVGYVKPPFFRVKYPHLEVL